MSKLGGRMILIYDSLMEKVAPIPLYTMINGENFPFKLTVSQHLSSVARNLEQIEKREGVQICEDEGLSDHFPCTFYAESGENSSVISLIPDFEILELGQKL